MNSRQRILAALDHRQPDRVPLDLGATPVSGMHASCVYLLRQSLGLDQPLTPVKVVEPYQMLGEIGPDLMESLGVDAVGVGRRENMFGYENTDWKPWTPFDGTPVLVPSDFNTEPEPNGDILMYPQGDHSAPASGRMPKGGYYFDSIVRQEPIDNERLDPQDNMEEFGPVSDEDLHHFAAEADRLYRETDKAIVANFGGTAFGDIALVPAPFLKHPKRIRNVEEWYVSTVTRSTTSARSSAARPRSPWPTWAGSTRPSATACMSFSIPSTTCRRKLRPKTSARFTTPSASSAADCRPATQLPPNPLSPSGRSS